MKFRHVPMKEAKRRLAKIEEIGRLLDAAKEDLTFRAMSAVVRIPSPRGKGRA
jgi:hypothetical protein